MTTIEVAEEPTHWMPLPKAPEQERVMATMNKIDECKHILKQRLQQNKILRVEPNETDEALDWLLKRVIECSEYLKDGETPAECIQRNRDDVRGVMSLLAKEKHLTESLQSKAEAAEKRVAELEGDVADLRVIAKEQEDAHVTAKMDNSDLRECNEALQAKLDAVAVAWANRLPYKDESGIVSVTLNDAATITGELEAAIKDNGDG
jgi:hypothetical protein